MFFTWTGEIDIGLQKLSFLASTPSSLSYRHLVLPTSAYCDNNIAVMKAFLSELKRRNVFRVAAAYAVTAWLLIEIASVLLSNSEARLPMMMGLVILLAIGFALAVFISWTFEATPDGLKRTANVPAGEILPSWSPRKFAVFIVLVAALAASLFLYDVVRSRPRKAATPPTTTP